MSGYFSATETAFSSFTPSFTAEHDIIFSVRHILYINPAVLVGLCDDSADAVLFEAPANETAQLTDWVLLGTLSAGGQANLDVTLNVPIEMGNDFANQIGYLDWQFKIEEIPDPPKTGDEANLMLYGTVALVSLVALVAVLVVYKRKKTA